LYKLGLVTNCANDLLKLAKIIVNKQLVEALAKKIAYLLALLFRCAGSIF